jgi:ESS family glutamate:Na+ symporter
MEVEMDFSSANVPLWRFVIQMGIIAFTVILATIIRRKIPLIKKTLIPTSVLAGFILLLIKSTNLLYVDPEFLEMVTYHGIAIGFIALSLRIPREDKSPGAVRTAINSGALIVSTYLIQAITGLAISVLLAYTFMPNLFKASGILLPMGYGQGPGQANNVGSTYEKLGFVGGQSYGLAIAAARFLCSCIIGVIYLNFQSRKNKLKKEEHDEISGSVTIDEFQDQGEIPIAQSIDKLSIQVAFIVFVYLCSYLVLDGVSKLLGNYLPGVAKTVSPLLWGFNFIFGSLFAILFRVIITRLKKVNVITRQYQNNYLLSRISGLAFDVMIVTGIASINFEDISGLWVPFIITAIVGGIVTFLWVKFLCNRLYPDYKEESFLGMFGMLTGTISSGILLLREIDPNFKTPAANNLVSGSGSGIAFGAPVLVLISMAPKTEYMPLVVILLASIYLAILMGVMFIKRKKKD